MFQFAPMPHEEAVRRISELPLLARGAFDELLPELRAYAFTVSGVDAFDQLSKVKDVIAAVPQGEKTWDQAKKEIAADLAESLGGDEAERRAELLLRTHTFRAYAATRYRTLMEQRDVFPYWQYKTHGDGNVRPSHAALNGKIFPAGHPIWQEIFPPWDWGCRCLVVPLLGKDVDRRKEAEDKRRTAPENRQVYTQRDADVIAQAGRLPSGQPLNRSETWGQSPWSETGSVRHTWDLVRARYADRPEVLDAFREWAAGTKLPESGGRTVQDWLEADSARGFFAGKMGEISSYEVSQENTRIRAGNPERGEPMSAKLEITSGAAHRELMVQAGLLVDRVHDAKGLEKVVVGKDVREGQLGRYRPRAGKFMPRIDVSTEGPRPVLTGLHEIGHHLMRDLPEEDRKKVIRALKRTSSYRRIIEEDLDTPDKYYQRESELLARAYAQVIAENAGPSRARKELDEVLSGVDDWMQFSGLEWTEAVDSIKVVLNRL